MCIQTDQIESEVNVLVMLQNLARKMLDIALHGLED